jgi:hypothetical protein
VRAKEAYGKKKVKAVLSANGIFTGSHDPVIDGEVRETAGYRLFQSESLLYR